MAYRPAAVMAAVTAGSGRPLDPIAYGEPATSNEPASRINIRPDARGLMSEDGEPGGEQGGREQGGGEQDDDLTGPRPCGAPSLGEKDGGRDHLCRDGEGAVVMRVAEGRRGNSVGRPPGRGAALAAQRAQHEPGGEPGQCDPQGVHPDVTAVSDLVGVDGDEERGDDRSPSPGRTGLPP